MPRRVYLLTAYEDRECLHICSFSINEALILNNKRDPWPARTHTHKQGRISHRGNGANAPVADDMKRSRRKPPHSHTKKQTNTLLRLATDCVTHSYTAIDDYFAPYFRKIFGCVKWRYMKEWCIRWALQHKRYLL